MYCKKMNWKISAINACYSHVYDHSSQLQKVSQTNLILDGVAPLRQICLSYPFCLPLSNDNFGTVDRGQNVTTWYCSLGALLFVFILCAPLTYSTNRVPSKEHSPNKKAKTFGWSQFL